jgi:hypothetical protein
VGEDRWGGLPLRNRRCPDRAPLEDQPKDTRGGDLLAARTGEEEEVLSAAAAVFLSPKTVEDHLRHVYMKLGIRSRAEPADGLSARP